MSVLEMKVPSPGESISEVEIAQWLVSDGDYVEKDQAIAEVGKVAEGLNTLKLVKQKADELGDYMHLARALYRVIYEGEYIDNIIPSLMQSEQALDVEFAARDEKQLNHQE